MIKNKFSSGLSWLNKHKLIWLAIITFVIAIALPGAIGFAKESSANQTTDQNTPNAVTFSGSVTDLQGKVIDDSKEPYVQIAYAYLDLQGELQLGEQYIEVTNGKYTIKNIPTLPLVGTCGVITAGAKGYANEILPILGASSSTTVNFKLSIGSQCTFVNEKEKLQAYYLCVGSTVTTADGTSVTLPEEIGDISLGGGLPVFGAPVGSTLTENKTKGTLTYHYRNPNSPEEYNLIFRANGEPSYNFKKWSINNADVPSPSYVVKANEDIVINPV